ncbi:hypothetical protein BGW38_004382 [Lunasporangiospora selenospora]|uniref:RlpA-like protein double-psi beta-barrel domain-containing protein n=1 Tax=Lunasporangiospora selenospora TaxID=979761 RepID=A0A9P6KBK5_9FUNG|nr:hypothetical protein BGW38_004382 [Lunasporangiospora selenospora]
MAIIYKFAIVAAAALAMVSAAPVNNKIDATNVPVRNTTATLITAKDSILDSANAQGSVSIQASGSGPFTGRGTWFTDDVGSCGTPFNTNDMIVAMNEAKMGGRAMCGRYVSITYGGKTVRARVTDTCPSQYCSSTALDMSQAVFKQLAPLDKGVIQVQWSFV